MTENVFIQESIVNATTGYIVFDSEVYETHFKTSSEVYKFSMQEYGRCIGKVYIDGSDNKPVHIGWIFQKREKYTDCNKTYLQETWVTLHKSLPVKSIKYDYFQL